ncbi:MAG: glycosyltransferase [Isosphaeraceae bacterium]|nr:glycosyltransferase [Isosphaeraceae bacterium]
MTATTTSPMLAPLGLVLVNGPPTSVQGPRARALFGDDVPILYKDRGRFGSIRSLRSALGGLKTGWIYCIDLGIPGSLLAAWRRRRSRSIRLVYEIGDPGRPLFEAQGRPIWHLALAEAMDRRLPMAADRLVFRGSYLADYFRKLVEPRSLPPWIWLPDGAEVDRFRPRRNDPEVAALRRAHGLEGRFVVGIVGTVHHNPIYNLTYGWDLAEALGRLPQDLPITGVVVGDGSGRPVLEATRERLGLGDRLRLIGRVPHEQVPLWMNVFDVALSTQTDDPVGWGRTTAKLPEYLACGTPVLSTDVGEAHRLLRESGQTLPYQGMRDEAYPERLANRLQEWIGQDLTPLREHNRELALRLFDYRVLRRSLAEFLAAPSEAVAVSAVS